MTLQQAQQQQQQLQEKIDQSQAGLNASKARAAAALERLNADNQALGVIAGSLSVLSGKEAVTRGDLRQIEAELVVLRAELNTRQVALGRRLRAIFEYGNVGYLNVLLGANSFGDFLTRFYYLRQIVAGDVTLLHVVQTQRNATVRKEASLTAVQSRLRGLIRQDLGQENLAAAKVADRRRIVATLENDVAARRAAIQQLEEAQAQVTAIISQLQGSSGTAASLANIHFIWPAKAVITRPFGENYDPVLKKMEFHSGIDIGVWYGTTVVAAAAGKVIYAGWIIGYGNTVILDNGNGVTTLYAHAEKILVHKGDQVAQGQPITLAGATGYATGPHLHFEIRLNNVPVNPILYLPPQ